MHPEPGCQVPAMGFHRGPLRHDKRAVRSERPIPLWGGDRKRRLPLLPGLNHNPEQRALWGGIHPTGQMNRVPIPAQAFPKDMRASLTVLKLRTTVNDGGNLKLSNQFEI